LLLLSHGFVAGLICFLFVLLLYTIYFLRVQPLTYHRAMSASLIFLLISGLFSLFIVLLWEHFGDLKLSIIVYSGFLAIMLAMAFNTYYGKTTKRLAINFFIPGCLLFILSDLTLAANKFYFQESFLNIAIIACYCGAQYYLSRGFIKHLQSRKPLKESQDVSMPNHKIHPN
jgi:uncharacterized membrane protein YhhN